MRYLLKASGIAAAIALMAVAPSAVAQESTSTLACQDVGVSAPEPLGDREGHSILTSQTSCRVDLGPVSGGVSTGTDIWEWNGPKAVLLSSSGVVRKPGATVVYLSTAGTLALTMTDGKVTGWTASGLVLVRGRIQRNWASGDRNHRLDTRHSKVAGWDRGWKPIGRTRETKLTLCYSAPREAGANERSPKARGGLGCRCGRIQPTDDRGQIVGQYEDGYGGT